AAKAATGGQIQLGQHAMDTIDILARTTTRREMADIVEALYTGARSRAFLDGSPEIGVQLLTRVFRASPQELETFLDHISKLSADDAATTLAALIRIPHLSTSELGIFRSLAEEHATEFTAWLRVAEAEEIRAFIRLVAPPAQVERDAVRAL